jgi:hypothetical protein
MNCKPVFRAALKLSCILALSGSVGHACSCAWRGPFLAVAPLGKAVIRAQVVRYHGSQRGLPLAMDLNVVEVLRGEGAPGALRVWGDNGLLCRPAVTRFPISSEWLFVLDGPGAKTGISPGPSISICGEYWLQVRDGQAVGIVRGSRQDGPAEALSLEDLRSRLAGSGAAPPEVARARLVLRGELKAGEAFERLFGPSLSFRLTPVPTGWSIEVHERGRDEDLARLTPPLHFTPNARDVEGWHFRNRDNTGPNSSGDKNVNAPGRARQFIFSPEVGRTIAGPQTTTAISPEDVDRVRAFGRGELRILDYRLKNLKPGQQAAFEWMRFEVELSWPRQPEQR